MDFEIITYGGLDILKPLFDGIAMLANGGPHGLFRPLIFLGIGIGFFWSVTHLFFNKSSYEHMLGKYFLPTVVLTYLLFLPTASVHIVDITKPSLDSKKHDQIDNVPYVLAFLSHFVSSIGYNLTSSVEAVMHGPDDVLYNKTGHIFGAETSLEANQYIITNADLLKNMNKFVNQCVVYDLQMGRYTLEELQKTNNIYQFLQNKTSKVFGMDYLTIKDSYSKNATSPKKNSSLLKLFGMNFFPVNGGDSNDTTLKNPSGFCSCRNAMEQMKPYFDKESKYYSNHTILKNIPISYKALTGLEADSKNLIDQQLMIQALYQSNSPVVNLSKARAALQQRETYYLVGSLASKSLVAMRNVFEALIYVSFIFLIPMFFFPSGLKILGTWVQLMLWIQMWPPFYAILNYIMQIIAHSRALNIVNESNTGINLFTSVGLENLHADMLALAGYLSASIPFVSYALIKGGVSSFIHMASSMMTPAHSAASAAATEQVTGNYSYGNISMGNMNYGNASMLQRNFSPSLSEGYSTVSTGGDTSVMAGERLFYNQNVSQLRSNIVSDEIMQNSVQQAKLDATSLTTTEQSLFLEGAQGHSRQLSSFSDHIAKNSGYADAYGTGSEYSLQDSARYFKSLSEDFAKQSGVSETEASDWFFKAGVGAKLGLKIPFTNIGAELGADGGHSTHTSSATTEMETEIEKIASGEEFQKHLQNLERGSHSQNFSQNDEEGVRLANEVSHSQERMQSSQKSYLDALNSLEQISQTESLMKTNGSGIKSNLNQSFVDWLSEKYSNDGGFGKVKNILQKDELDPEKRALMQEFSSKVLPKQIESLYRQDTLRNKYSDNSAWINNIIGPTDDSKTAEHLGANAGLSRGTAAGRGAELKSSYLEHSGNVAQNNQNLADKIDRQNKNVSKKTKKH